MCTLAKRVTVTIVHILQGVFTNFARVVNEVAEGMTLRIIGKYLDSTTVGWWPCPNCTIDKGLNGSGWSSKLLG
jgi:hypothetical protein